MLKVRMIVLVEEMGSFFLRVKIYVRNLNNNNHSNYENGGDNNNYYCNNY